MIPDMKIYMAALLERLSYQNMHRADWHDYHSKRIYMITLRKMPGIPDFCKVTGEITKNDTISAETKNSRVGNILWRNLSKIPEMFAEMRVIQYKIMPDHIHILIESMDNHDYHLDDVVAAYKNCCDIEYSEILKRRFRFDFRNRIFQPGYNDRILSGEGQLDILFEYIKDNPRRYYIKQAFPEYFTNCIKYRAKDEEYALYGNILLLEHTDKNAVKFSHKDSLEQLQKKMHLWEETIRSGGVLVSPFIHKAEKRYLQKALDNGGKIILIREYGFPKRWKPEKRFFDACAEGRVLFIGPAKYMPAKIKLTKILAEKMNAIAAGIAKIRRGQYRLKQAR